ncbi:hypothetical protein HPB47_019613 [Ixodes persulcatus]|uniref:Uncharacterized protein n=1 Tax=Ixodes persulcatus TaxID=34615 RepID=A0AC60QIK6_IXOPE|nr:hypothetical protein HPB47_019613 [Ixodes persulcatus]
MQPSRRSFTHSTCSSSLPQAGSPVHMTLRSRSGTRGYDMAGHSAATTPAVGEQRRMSMAVKVLIVLVVITEDPYAVNKACWTSDVKLLPPKSTAHVVVYLVFSPSQFTADTVQAYKSLEAYDYFDTDGIPIGPTLDHMAQSRWRDVRRVYGQLAADSGLPGADVMSSDSRVRKILWLAALVPLVYYAVGETTAILREYLAYSVAVAYEYDTNDTLVFPDVTVCNVNPFRRSRLCGMPAAERGMDPQLDARLCGDPVQVFKDANVEDLAYQQNLSVWAASRKLKDDRWLRDLGHQFQDTVVDCSYADQDCKNMTYFQESFDSRHGTCLCFHCNKSEMDFFSYGSLASPQNGRFPGHDPLARHQHATVEPGKVCDGVTVYARRYSVCSDGVYITPGRATYVGLNVLDESAVFAGKVYASFHRLPAPYANPCRRDWPSMLLRYLTSTSISYTREECLNMCLQVNTRRECGCQSRLLPSLPKTGKQAESTHDDADESTQRSGPLARLVVYFNSLAYEHIRSVPKYDGTRVLSNIGGINGMYLGLSFFVLFQVLDMVVIGALKLRTMWQRDYKRPRARE